MLDTEDKYILILANRGKDESGWAKVSRPVMPLVRHLPSSLVDVVEYPTGEGRVRLTEEGKTVLRYLT